MLLLQVKSILIKFFIFITIIGCTCNLFFAPITTWDVKLEDKKRYSFVFFGYETNPQASGKVPTPQDSEEEGETIKESSEKDFFNLNLKALVSSRYLLYSINYPYYKDKGSGLFSYDSSLPPEV